MDPLDEALFREATKDWSPRKRVKLVNALQRDPNNLTAGFNTLRLFNDPPRLEDVQALLESYLADSSPVKPPSLQGEQLVMEICRNIWISLHPSLKSVPRYGEWSHVYLEGKKQVCTFGSPTEPSLLWTTMDCPFETSEIHKDKIFSAWNRKKHLAVLLGASGAGKTRTILEWGCHKNCMFLTGQSDLGPGHFGSGDVLAVAMHLQQLFGLEPITNTNALCCCTFALLFARFFIWKMCKEARPEITSYDWLCLQLEFRRLGTEDIFERLTSSLINEFVHRDDSGNWHAISCMFQMMVQQMIENMQWEGFIAVDECQIVDRYLSNRFSSVTLGDCRRSMLSPLLIELAKCPKVSAIVVSGTGPSLLNLRSVFESHTVKQHLEYTEILDFKGFERVEEMIRYANAFIDTTCLDMHKIFSIYRGRYRFFVTALERYMGADCINGTLFFIEFAEKLCKATGAELGLLRSLHDDVVKLFDRKDPKQVLLVIELVLGFYFRGVCTMVFLESNALQFVECGIGRIFVDSNADKRVFNYMGKVLYSENYSMNARAKLDEPLVMKALLNFLQYEPTGFANICTQRFLHASSSDAKIGEDYEVYVAAGLGRFFDGKCPIDMLPACIMATSEQISNVYKEKADLVVSKDPVLACLVRDVTPEYRLLHWLQDIEHDGSFATYLHTGLDNDCGPDLIFVLYIEAMKKYMPVLCQMKSGEVDQIEAFISLDVAKMYQHNRSKTIFKKDDSEGVQKLKEWCSSGYIQLLVTTPMANMRASLEKHYAPKKELPKRLKSQPKKVSDAPCEKPLRGIVDKDNCSLFLDEWVCIAIANLKEDTKRMRKSLTTSHA
ncbi:hypothetical protein GOP47_0013956 [Adiantum capillus-veneris]|uniref:Uncharacterized protein n=1 Tax=Adiantum capillus-veneris TaxID=13818 RepID=A0A9D4UPS6_ADICA|nr:hypothetical protein GOP47_0013956 [Adiantum capillus-veneris]